MTKLLNENQVAQMTGMSVFWLRRMRWRGGGIPYIKLGVGARAAVRYRQEDVETYIADRMRESTSDAGTAAKN